MTVLVLTADLDPTADLVIAELNRRDTPIVRIDPGDFPAKLSLTAVMGSQGWCGRVRGQHRDVSMPGIRSVYYRRPSDYRLPADLAEADREWSRAEAMAGLGGVLASLDCVWVNHPHANRRAGLKPLALATAARAGLTVPNTLITNEPDRARRFVRQLPGGVAAYKPLGSTMPPQEDDGRVVLWTNRVAAEEIDTGVSCTAHQFQRWVDKSHEVRLTAVGEELFAAEIHAGSEASRIDFRTDYDSLTYKVCGVPEVVADGVRSLMAAFGLRYAALDFLVDNDGIWFFVDLNPNGQFGFVPDLRKPITTALANLLEGVPR
ncbi:ATP-grasp ribosomal peptide maturase [Kitasatospora sp. CB01950]|uniref:ATP-grasp ribosomal peptide maturase n=1 Tax=Kitasatospora sp. CB01950 TaxID=1703930 RepID=UPI00094012B6|nr:ATP-grasp ribosomal peptide maturase [Kitasatospora sp. CB01950]OKJ09130.1 alpha-L-glutamate ligase [Kitasatospora sp. CB01950]